MLPAIVTLKDSITLRTRIHRGRVGRIDCHRNHARMAHPMRQIRPGLAPIARLVDVVVRRDVDDVGILRIELYNNNGIAAIAAREGDGQEKTKDKNSSHAQDKTLRDAQKGRPARPQRVKRRGVLFSYVEPLNDARTKLADFFSIPI